MEYVQNLVMAFGLLIACIDASLDLYLEMRG
jgi:hypothetical protein